MQIWINFIIFIFWLTLFGFIINTTNFIILLFFSELIWIILYSYSICVGAINDDILTISLSFLLLGFASIEFSIGFLIIILLKLYNLSINLSDNDKINSHLFLKKSIIQYNKINWL